MTDSRTVRNGGRRRAQRGVSLLEILVVLVLLVLGILIIVRLFPSGFFSIESAGNAALADGLGSAALGAQTQDLGSLPDAVLPVNTSDTPPSLLPMSAAVAAANANYNPDDPNLLDKARVVSNETITVPSASSGQSVYAVKYGPVVMPADPAVTVAQLPNYFTVNSTNWKAQAGSAAAAAAVGSTDLPQDTLVPGQERLLVDLAAKKIAVPYAAYTPTTSPPTQTTVGTIIANSYPQAFVVSIVASDGNTYTQYLNVPAGTPRDNKNPYAPFDSGNKAYLPDTYTASGNYQGGWLDPTTQYGGAPASGPPSTATWVSVTLYRPYNGVRTNASFSNDPCEFKLLASNFGTANPGAVGFNPKAAGGAGTSARQAQISYVTSTWSILHEDRDIPALSGSDTSAIRLTLKNLLMAGSANPDNTINPGIAGSGKSLMILDLDSGIIIAPTTDPNKTDPTNPDKPIIDEDLNGTSTDPTQINVSYATGRLTFGSGVFGDNKAHRVRIFYQGDANWTVAVQKAPAYFAQVAPVVAAPGTTSLAADQFTFDAPSAFAYFARCNAGKTVELDGTYTAGGVTKSFSDTVAIDPTLYAAGDTDVYVNLADPMKVNVPVPQGAVVTFSAVRGLSSRAVVAWKERNQWKVHTVDTILTRPQP